MTQARRLCQQQVVFYILTTFISLFAFVWRADADDLKVLPEKLDGVQPSRMLHAYLMHKAHAAIDEKLAKESHSIFFTGLVGSIDNDMYGTDMTIGADSALNRTRTR